MKTIENIPLDLSKFCGSIKSFEKGKKINYKKSFQKWRLTEKFGPIFFYIKSQEFENSKNEYKEIIFNSLKKSIDTISKLVNVTKSLDPIKLDQESFKDYITVYEPKIIEGIEADFVLVISPNDNFKVKIEEFFASKIIQYDEEKNNSIGGLYSLIKK